MDIAQALKRSWDTPANRLDWIIAGVNVGQWAYKKYKQRTQRVTDIVLHFSSEDPPYHWFARWLERLPRQDELTDFKVITVSDSLKDGLMMVPNEGIHFQYKGVDCWIEQGNDMGSSETIRDLLSTSLKPVLKLRMRTRDQSICKALLDELGRLALKKQPPQVMAYRWGGWQTIRKVPSGRVAILPQQQVDAIIKDLETFRNSEAWYQSVGLPHRRGYLLQGIPGSGKTSLVVQIASHFELNVCIINLSDNSDSGLLEQVRYIPPDSVFLFEDIDCAFTGRKTKDASSRLTYSGLLNAIDGVATPDGRVSFMTTNHRDRLDEALIRPGRVDFELEFTHAVPDQIMEMAKRFSPYTDIDAGAWANEKISMATVQERLIQKYRAPIRVAGTLAAA